MEEDGGGEPQETTFSGTPNAAPAEAPAGAFDQPAVMMGPKSSLPKVMGILMMLYGAGMGLLSVLALLVVGTTVSDYCLLYTSPSPRDVEESRMPSSA